jgi:hypothetical protein
MQTVINYGHRSFFQFYKIENTVIVLNACILFREFKYYISFFEQINFNTEPEFNRVLC